MGGTPGIRGAARALYEAVRAGLPDPDTLPDLGFDAEFLERTAPLLEFLYARYFRVSLEGIEHVPASHPALIVANHSGAVPYDGAILIHAFRTRHPARRVLRPLVASFALRSSWMRPIVARAGCVRASMQNALALLGRGSPVGVFPEGLQGVGKLYRERYRLTHFGRGGFVRLARLAGVPIIPVAIVGAEEIHPVVAKVTRAAKPFGLPYIPITPTFPWLGPFGLLPVPTRWSIRIGAPVDAWGSSPAVPAGVVAEAVRERMDEMIADLLVHRRSILFG